MSDNQDDNYSSDEGRSKGNNFLTDQFILNAILSPSSPLQNNPSPVPPPFPFQNQPNNGAGLYQNENTPLKNLPKISGANIKPGEIEVTAKSEKRDAVDPHGKPVNREFIVITFKNNSQSTLRNVYYGYSEGERSFVFFNQPSQKFPLVDAQHKPVTLSPGQTREMYIPRQFIRRYVAPTFVSGAQPDGSSFYKKTKSKTFWGAKTKMQVAAYVAIVAVMNYIGLSAQFGDNHKPTHGTPSSHTQKDNQALRLSPNGTVLPDNFVAKKHHEAKAPSVPEYPMGKDYSVLKVPTTLTLRNFQKGEDATCVMPAGTPVKVVGKANPAIFKGNFDLVEFGKAAHAACEVLPNRPIAVPENNIEKSKPQGGVAPQAALTRAMPRGQSFSA